MTIVNMSYLRKQGLIGNRYYLKEDLKEDHNMHVCRRAALLRSDFSAYSYRLTSYDRYNAFDQSLNYCEQIVLNGCSGENTDGAVFNIKP